MQELEKILEEIDERIENVQKAFINNENMPGYLLYKKTMEEAKGIIRKNANDGWIPVNERLPENDRSVLMCGDTGCIDVGWWNGKRWKTGFSHADNFEAVAWRPLPEPYQAERSDNNDGE